MKPARSRSRLIFPRPSFASRPSIGGARASPKTTASFDYVPGKGKGRRIDNLTIKGNGLLIKGQITVGPGGQCVGSEVSHDCPERG